MTTSTADASTDTSGALTNDPPGPTDADALRAALHSREQELAAISARLQQHNEALTAVVERLERTVSASIDRFVRRLDRMENAARRGYDSNTAAAHHRTNCNNSSNKRSKYND